MRAARILPALLFLVAAAGTAVLGARIVATERASAERTVRERLRVSLKEAELRIREQAARLGRRVAEGETDAVVGPDRRVLSPPPFRPLTRLAPPRGRDPEADFYLAEGERVETVEGDPARAEGLYRAAAAAGRDPESRALALHRLAALARRAGDAEAAEEREAVFLDALPEGKRDCLEALLVRAGRRPLDADFAADLAVHLDPLQHADPLLSGLLEMGGLDGFVFRARRGELALREALRPLAEWGVPAGGYGSGTGNGGAALLPSPGPRGYRDVRVERPWVAAWATEADGSRRFLVEPLADLPTGVLLLEDARHSFLAGAVEEHLEPDAPIFMDWRRDPLHLVARESPDVVAAAARRSAWMVGTSLAALLLAGATALWLSVRAARREAAAARARADFVTRVGHDLRTPLAKVRMYAETLASGKVADPTEAREFAGIAAREAEALTAMVGKVLDLDRASRGPAALERRPVDLAALAEEVATWHRPLLERAGMRLEVRVAGPLPVLADGAALRGAVSNLLENAARHAASGGSVEVEALAAGRMAVVRVLDRGPGLPEGREEDLFARFARGPGAAGSGAGLGLALVREAAEAHGGTAGASNREGGGAAVEVRLPLGGEVA